MQRLKIHPRDKTRNKAVLSRASRLYQESLGESRTLIGDQIDLFHSILDRQSPNEIEAACVEFTQIMDSIENHEFDNEELHD